MAVGGAAESDAAHAGQTSKLVFEFELDPWLGQLCARGALLLRGDVCFPVVAVPGFCDFELPLDAANATPPPAATADTAASARMRLNRLIFRLLSTLRRWKQANLSGA